MSEHNIEYYQLIETAPDAVIVINEQGAIINWNHEASIMFEWTKQEVLGKKLTETIIPKKYHAAHIHGMENFLKTNKGPSINKPVELVAIKKDEKEFPVEIKISATKINNQYIFIGFIRDITHRKKTEEKITQLNKKLEKNLTQLEFVNQELKAFNYSVSHDLRAPLRAINGYTNILFEGYTKVLDNEGKKMLKEIIGKTKKMGQIIDGLLSLSHLGQKQLQFISIDINKLVRTAISEVSASFSSNKTQFNVAVLPTVVADYNLLSLVFTNLISNAIKYSINKEKPIVEIGSKNENNRTVYYVKDNGAGFNMKYSPKLFGVFQRLHHSHEFEGTGLGLALVKRIIDRHGGSVWADAEVNKGATFYFYLNTTSNPLK